MRGGGWKVKGGGGGWRGMKDERGSGEGRPI